jgi:hypothetical protein
MTIRRDRFGDVLEFTLINRFSAELGIATGYVWIRSIRTFTTAPPVKFSLSRSLGWFTQNSLKGGVSPGREMKFEPYKGSVESWNAAHADSGNPYDFYMRLNTAWHAYAVSDSTLPSSDFPEFWRVKDSFDRVHGVITNYLVRFTVNTDLSVSPVPFQVFLQPEVRQIELEIESNLSPLSGRYTFIVQ